MWNCAYYNYSMNILAVRQIIFIAQKVPTIYRCSFVSTLHVFNLFFSAIVNITMVFVRIELFIFERHYYRSFNPKHLNVLLGINFFNAIYFT